MKKATVAIVGCGRVGSSIAYGLALRQLCDEILLCDVDQVRAAGEVYDIQDVCMTSDEDLSVRAAGYADCAGADILVIAAGAARKPGQTIQENVSQSVKTCRKILDGVLENGFQGIVLFVGIKANTVLQDILHYSRLPANRVIGPGNMLETNRLRVAVSDGLGVPASEIKDLYVLGEDCATFSAAMVGKTPLLDRLSREQAQELLNHSAKKGSIINNSKPVPTYYGISSAVIDLIEAILYNECRTVSVSAILQGAYGLEDVFIGVPAVVGKHGIERVCEIPLDAGELDRLAAAQEAVKSDNFAYLQVLP